MLSTCCWTAYRPYHHSSDADSSLLCQDACLNPRQRTVAQMLCPRRTSEQNGLPFSGRLLHRDKHSRCGLFKTRTRDQRRGQNLCTHLVPTLSFSICIAVCLCQLKPCILASCTILPSVAVDTLLSSLGLDPDPRTRPANELRARDQQCAPQCL